MLAVVTERVQAGAGMRIDIEQRGGLRDRCIDHRRQNAVLEDVGEIAGVKAVSVAEQYGDSIRASRTEEPRGYWAIVNGSTRPILVRTRSDLVS